MKVQLGGVACPVMGAAVIIKYWKAVVKNVASFIIVEINKIIVDRWLLLDKV
jgi:hypothetical protein